MRWMGVLLDFDEMEVSPAGEEAQVELIQQQEQPIKMEKRWTNLHVRKLTCTLKGKPPFVLVQNEKCPLLLRVKSQTHSDRLGTATTDPDCSYTSLYHMHVLMRTDSQIIFYRS